MLTHDAAVTWRLVRASITRPYPVTWPMIALISLVPLYIVIAAYADNGVVHRPALPLDDALPLVPAWSLVYGAFYVFLIAVPLFVLQSDALIRRAVWAYLMVWLVAYACFLAYPTIAPRGEPATVAGDGFAAWGLRALYGSDPPYNCFPSLHVAHSFVSALACHRVNRRLGWVTLACASLVGLSTVFTKQHYVVDVIAGAALALVASEIFLRRFPRASIPDLERRLAPVLALGVAALSALGLLGFWVFYLLTVNG